MRVGSSIIWFAAILFSFQSCNGFPVTSTHPSRDYQRLYSTSASNSFFSTSCASDVFVLSFDGVLADTINWKVNLAIDVALETWPHLQDYLCTNDEDRAWIVRKMSALSHLMISDSDGMMGCDFVLLARLILEEQLLDGGRSLGVKGKYGSKYHPSQGTSGKVVRKSARHSSRPLTVGEIAANWMDGLKETTRIKYNLKNKDPIPVIKKHISFMAKDAINSIPTINTLIGEELLKCGSKVYVLVGHESQIAMVQASIKELGEKGENIQLLTRGCGDEHSKIVENLVKNASGESFFYVIHSSLRTLQNMRSLFGDDSQRLTNGFGKSKYSEHVKLKFCMPSWADSFDYQQAIDVETDPWLNLMEESELIELLSTRISMT